MFIAKLHYFNFLLEFFFIMGQGDSVPRQFDDSDNKLVYTYGGMSQLV